MKVIEAKAVCTDNASQKHFKNMCKVSVLAAAISALMPMQVQADDSQFAGYFRSGVSIGDNGSQQCTAVFGVGRLGNECGTYGELQWKKKLYEKDGKSFALDTMLAVYSDQNEDFEILDGGSDGIAARQFNVTATGLLGFAPEATIWAGKRFYQRHDVHHLDMFYWDTTGPGAGIEGIKTGLGTFSAAVIRSDQKDVNANIVDLRLADLKLGGKSKLEVGVNYNWRNLDKTQKAAGESDEGSVLLTGEINTPLANGGYNKFVVQYGNNGYASPLTTSGYNGGKVINVDDLDDGASGFRVINHGLVGLTPNVDVAYAAWVAKSDRDTAGNDIEAYSLSARPSYKWDKHNKTYLELGHHATSTNNVDSSLSKVTVAHAFSAGDGFFARPEIRVFASAINSDSDVPGAAGPFRDGEDSVVSVGVQAEVWW